MTPLKQIGNVVNPPVQLQKVTWYTVRVVNPEAMPLEVEVFVYRGKPSSAPVVRLATILHK